jgi:hexosaminidase
MTLRYTTDSSLPGVHSPVLPASLIIRDNRHLRIAAFGADDMRGDVYDLDFKRERPAESVSPATPTQPGLVCSRYTGSFRTVAALASRQPDTVMTVSAVTVPAALEAPAFGLQYRGWIEVPADGIYSFYLTCDDGGVLSVGGREVIDNDGNHAPLEKTGQVALKKGLQPFRLDFIEGGGGYTLRLKYSFSGRAPTDVPAGWLRH